MRLKSDFRVSVKHKDGRTIKLELIKLLNKKYQVRVDGLSTERVVTLTEFFSDMRKWFVKGE